LPVEEGSAFVPASVEASEPASVEAPVVAASFLELEESLLPHPTNAVAERVSVATKANVLLSVFIGIFLLKYVYYAPLEA
jgi:hypothetical protein